MNNELDKLKQINQVISVDKISVIIPAHNEEKYIARCLESIKRAALKIDAEVEIIVSLNHCSDRTAVIATSYHASLVKEDQPNISKVRNRGIEAATGNIVVTIDADSWMSENILQEVLLMLQSGLYIGGGVRIKPERFSLGIAFSLLSLVPYLIKYRLSAGMFWCFKSDFEAVGGFDDSYLSAEDLNFAIKLKSYGNSKGLKYGTIKKAHITTSCRKFDLFGDWYLFKNPRLVKAIFSGKDKKAAKGFYYDVDR